MVKFESEYDDEKAVRLKNYLAALAKARETWPNAILCRAVKDHVCDWVKCFAIIYKGSFYINPGDANPNRAGGFGSYRYCLMHFGGGDENDRTSCD